MNTTIKILAIVTMLTGCAAPAVLGDTITWDIQHSFGDDIRRRKEIRVADRSRVAYDL